jgi:outer membrane protein TolC
MRKASYSKFFPAFDFTGQYLRLHNTFNLLPGDLFLPVVPHSAINPATGRLNPLQLLQADPPALVFGTDGMPLRDPDGNFIFRNYAFIPQSAGEIGQKNNVLMSFSMLQPIYTGGKIRAQYRMARQMEQMAGYGRQRTRNELLLEAESFFWQLITLQEKRELALQYVKMLESLVKDMDHYLEEGLVNVNDLLKARIALQEAELEVFRAENGIFQVSMALCRITGMPLTRKITAAEDLQFQEEELLLEDLWYSGLENRPEVKLAAGQASLAAATADLAQGARLPDVALSASWLAANPNPWRGLEKEFGQDWVVGITFTMPVFHWGERRNMHQAAIHEKNAMMLKLEDTHDLIRIDITRAYTDYMEALKMRDVKKLSLEQAQENLSLARDSFEEGMLRATGLLEAQTLWQQAATDYLESRANVRTKHASLQKAIGKI